MAFGIDRTELIKWKNKIERGEVAILTHYWMDKRFPGCTSVTKVGCQNIATLVEWGNKYDLQPTWIHYHQRYPHFDLFGARQKHILMQEGLYNHIERFNL